jgi:copper homeostasis protein (lipoprotein)
MLAAAVLSGCGTPAPARAPGDHVLELPASFSGTLPCPDCAGIRAQLDLWPDGVFHLGRDGEGTPDRDDDLGRWRRDPGSPVILLYGGREMPLQFAVVGPRALRALDLNGKPAGTGDRYDLRSAGQLQPAELSRGLHGMFAYMADAATFEECLTGRRYPVAMDGDYLALERAYLARPDGTPGAPVMASFDGAITRRTPMEGTGTVPTVVVRRFVGLWPDQTCERAMSHASLSPQYWRIASLEGAAVGIEADQREPHLILRGDTGGYVASAGADRIEGKYRVDGNRIGFLSFTTPVPRGEESQAPLATLLAVLASAHSWKIQGQVLELFNASGKSIAVLEAVYLR